MQVLVTMDSERGAGRDVPVRRVRCGRVRVRASLVARRMSERACGTAKETRRRRSMDAMRCDAVEKENAEYVGGLLRWSSVQAACAAICLHSRTHEEVLLATERLAAHTAGDTRDSERTTNSPTWQSRLRQNSSTPA
jgi:hypothetical protein